MPYYVHKMRDKYCEINRSPGLQDAIKTWGPFDTEDEAIAHRAKMAKEGECIKM
jgi:hypothetical protein